MKLVTLIMKKTPVTVLSMMMTSDVKTNIVIVLSMARNPIRSNLAALSNQDGLETVLMTKKTSVTVNPTKKSHMQNNATIVLSVSDYPCGANIAPLNREEGLKTRLMTLVMKKTPVTVWSMMMASDVKTNIGIVLSMVENPCMSNLASLNPQEGF